MTLIWLTILRLHENKEMKHEKKRKQPCCLDRLLIICMLLVSRASVQHTCMAAGCHCKNPCYMTCTHYAGHRLQIDKLTCTYALTS